eukprot:6180344-Pleurochrysis_carterae.AAC.1
MAVQALMEGFPSLVEAPSRPPALVTAEPLAWPARSKRRFLHRRAAPQTRLAPAPRPVTSRHSCMSRSRSLIVQRHARSSQSPQAVQTLHKPAGHNLHKMTLFTNPQFTIFTKWQFTLSTSPQFTAFTNSHGPNIHKLTVSAKRQCDQTAFCAWPDNHLVIMGDGDVGDAWRVLQGQGHRTTVSSMHS